MRYNLLFLIYHIEEDMRSLELQAIVLKLEKDDGVADLKESSAEIGDFHDPEILSLGSLDLAASEGVHVGSYDLHYFFAHSKTLCVLGCNYRVTIRLESCEMVVMEESGKRTYFEIRTE